MRWHSSHGRIPFGTLVARHAAAAVAVLVVVGIAAGAAAAQEEAGEPGGWSSRSCYNFAAFGGDINITTSWSVWGTEADKVRAGWGPARPHTNARAQWHIKRLWRSVYRVYFYSETQSQLPIRDHQWRISRKPQPSPQQAVNFPEKVAAQSAQTPYWKSKASGKTAPILTVDFYGSGYYSVWLQAYNMCSTSEIYEVPLQICVPASGDTRPEPRGSYPCRGGV